jgi:hypothetical protein
MKVQAGRDVFHVDVRYTDLKPIGGGSYGFVCSAHDSITGEKVRGALNNSYMCKNAAE